MIVDLHEETNGVGNENGKKTKDIINETVTKIVNSNKNKIKR